MSLLVRRCVERSRLIKGLYEDWQIEHQEAMAAIDIEEMCAECKEACDLVERAWNILACHDAAREFEKTARFFHFGVCMLAETAREIADVGGEAVAEGYTINGIEELRTRVNTIEEIIKEIPRRWTFFGRKITNEHLKQLAEKHPPPAEWFEGEQRPF